MLNNIILYRIYLYDINWNEGDKNLMKILPVLMTKCIDLFFTWFFRNSFIHHAFLPCNSLRELYVKSVMEMGKPIQENQERFSSEIRYGILLRSFVYCSF